MKKLLKSKKALSPVVAAIILIAVTVAVSIAVAAWMGSLTFTFMETEECKAIGVHFSIVGSNGYLNVTIMNTGTTDVTVSAVTVAGPDITTTSTIVGGTADLTKGSTEVVDIQLGGAWAAGKAYSVELVSTKGNKFSYTATAPN